MNVDDKLAEIFEIEPITEKPLVVQPQQQLIPFENNKDQEFDYVTTNLHDLIDKGSQAVANALNVAAESQHPRAYEVAGNLIKNIGDLTDKLVHLQKIKQDMEIKENKPTKGGVNVNNAVFVGSTAELLKIVKQNETK